MEPVPGLYMPDATAGRKYEKSPPHCSHDRLFFIAASWRCYAGGFPGEIALPEPNLSAEPKTANADTAAAPLGKSLRFIRKLL